MPNLSFQQLIDRYAEKGIVLCKVWHDDRERISFYDPDNIVRGVVANTLIQNREQLLPLLPKVALLSSQDMAELSELAAVSEEYFDECEAIEAQAEAEADYPSYLATFGARLVKARDAALAGIMPYYPSQGPIALPGLSFSQGVTVRDPAKYFLSLVRKAGELRARWGEEWFKKRESEIQDSAL